MYKLLSVIILLVCGEVYNAAAQCNQYYIIEQGSEWEMETYNAKDKLTGKIRYDVKEFEKIGGGFNAVITNTFTNEKGKEMTTGDLGFRCEDGVIYIDMRNFVNEEQMKMFESYEMEMEGQNLEIPNDMSVGQALKDGSMKITTKGSPLPMTMTVDITDRKVVGQESITTPAGTFECYKVTSTSTIHTKMGVGMTMNFSALEWIAPEVGTVKSESYNKSGKLAGYTILVSRK